MNKLKTHIVSLRARHSIKYTIFLVRANILKTGVYISPLMAEWFMKFILNDASFVNLKKLDKKKFHVLMIYYFVVTFKGDRKKWLVEIADTRKITKERIGYIDHEYLGMRKAGVNWVQRKLTICQNQ